MLTCNPFASNLAYSILLVSFMVPSTLFAGMRFAWWVPLTVLSKAEFSMASGPVLRMVQTVYDPTDPLLLKESLGNPMEASAAPTTGALLVDSSVKFQELLGFGGAFTAAAAVNWRSMTTEDQERIVHMYFADPSEGGHGYTVGRVPMGSSDFAAKFLLFRQRVW